MMTSLAQFKRLAVVGARFERVFVDGDGQPTASATLIVNHVQSNAVAFRADPDDASTEYANRSWFWFPKGKRVRFEEGRMILLDLDGNPRMTLEYLGDQPTARTFE